MHPRRCLTRSKRSPADRMPGSSPGKDRQPRSSACSSRQPRKNDEARMTNVEGMTKAEVAPIESRHRAFSLGRLAAITTNTLTELTRLKVFYFLLIFALILIGSSVFMARLTFQQEFQRSEEHTSELH